MATEVRPNRMSQVVAWIAGSLFVLGLFLKPVGQWTQPILAVWFVGTQKPIRGFAWLLAFSFIPSLLFAWRPSAPEQALRSLGWLFLLAVSSVIPLSFHRLLSPHLPGFLATLPFPLAAAAATLFLSANTFLTTKALDSHFGLPPLQILWFAAILVWLWTKESRATAPVAAIALLAVGASHVLQHFGIIQPFELAASGTAIAWVCACGLMALVALAALNRDKPRSWATNAHALRILRSPWSANPLQLEGQLPREVLVSSSGERFPIRHGIPTFLRPEDLTGDNGKYNHLYETIGGFYNDTQRVFAAFRALDMDSYFINYMGLLEAKPGDSVLETSVGTGLNFKYLPRGAKLSGLDLSAEMLGNCQSNLRRLGLEADLYLGNAENLPFADESFNLVYTAGAINFFNDRARAIQEMIRVAKPGSLLMVQDETEKYVQGTYEKIPGSGQLYKNREQPVTIPIDLIPAEMEDVKLHMLKEDKFYAITFRKPASGRLRASG